MGGLHSFRSVAGFLQSAARMDRHRQSESVSGKLSLPGEWRVRGALSLAPDSRPVDGADRMEARINAGGREGCLFFVLEFSRGADCGGVRSQKAGPAGAGRS